MHQVTVNSRVIVGFEIHVQLATKTKLFCSCAVEFGAEPNTRVCPVCLGQPGSLPVMNRAAFELAAKAGLALNCTLNPFTKWDRKSYYYPDLPKNYQISQYDLPLARDGFFDVEVDGASRRIGIIRAHLEEDAGKNVHDVPGCTLVDLNRTGTPLLEIVSQPDVQSSDEAYAFCTELQRLVTFLGVSHGNMQKGQMRFEPNINVEIIEGDKAYRTPISEVKNLNSFRAVRHAVEFEHRRQVQDWVNDRSYLINDRPNENRGWDDDRGVTVFQRGKEAAHDYRYFPDPDLVPVELEAAWIEDLNAEMPELPASRKSRLVTNNGLTPEDADTILCDRETVEVFEEALGAGGRPMTLAKQFVNVWAKLAKDRGVTPGRLGVDAGRMGRLAAMVDEGVVSATSANQIAAELIDKDETPDALAESMGLVVVQDADQTRQWVDQAFAQNQQAVSDAVGNPKKAKRAAGFLRGQVMKLSEGKADPRLVGELIESRLSTSGDV